MKRFCLCLKIHIPLIYRNYRFLNIGHDHFYTDGNQTRFFTQKFATETLSPFLKSVKELSKRSEGKFRAGISVSGQTLQQLSDHTPKVIEQLVELLQNNVVEILSEPWSHTLLQLLDSRSLSEQIQLHDRAAKELVGVTPQVFIALSPMPHNLLPRVYANGKKGIFLYTNLFALNKTASVDKIVLINHLLSLSVNYEHTQSLSDTITSFFQNRSGDYCPEYPVVIVSRLLDSNSASLLKSNITFLATDENNTFLHPSETTRLYPSFTREILQSNKKLMPYSTSDYWLENNLQKEVFKKMKKIAAVLQTENSEKLSRTWNQIQDMENLRFMDMRFLDPNYIATHFTSYSSPYLAYINYMNVLDDFYKMVSQGESRKTKGSRLKGYSNYHQTKHSRNLLP